MAELNELIELIKKKKIEKFKQAIEQDESGLAVSSKNVKDLLETIKTLNHKNQERSFVVALLNATRLVEIDDKDISRIIVNKLITTLLYEHKRMNWDSDRCISLRRYIQYFRGALEVNGTDKPLVKMRPMDFRVYIEYQEEKYNTFYGSYLSDDSDSEDERGYEQLSKSEKKEIRDKANEAQGYAYDTVFKRKIENLLKKAPDFENEKIQTSQLVDLRERAIIHENSSKRKMELKKIVDDLNALIRKGKTLKQAKKEIERRYEKKLFVAQYRGITYLTTHFSQKDRRSHREKEEVGQPQYSPSVILGANNYHSMREYCSRIHREQEDPDKMDLWANALRKRMLAMHQSGKIVHKDYTFQHAAHLLQDVYSKNYDEYFSTIAGNNLFREYLFNEFLSFVSTSDVPEHAGRYGFGIKPYKGKEGDRLRPRWRADGRNERPYSGKVYISLHPLTDYEEGAHSVVTLNNQASVSIDNLIVAERETTFFSYIPSERVIHHEIAKYPSFGKYKQIYLKKYGLDEELFKAFKKLFEKTRPHTQGRKLFKQLLGAWLCSYHEVRFIEIARKKAEELNGYLVYRDDNGLFCANKPPEDSPFRNTGKIEEKIEKKDLANEYRATRKKMSSRLSQFTKFKKDHKFSAPRELIKCLNSGDRYKIETCVIDYDTTFCTRDEVKDFTSGGILIHYYTIKGNYYAVKALLEAGTPVNYRDKNGNTPLHLSLLNNRHEITQLLLNHYHPDLDIPNNQHITPRQLLSYLDLSEIDLGDCQLISPYDRERLDTYENALLTHLMEQVYSLLESRAIHYIDYRRCLAVAQIIGPNIRFSQVLTERLLKLLQHKNPLTRESAAMVFGFSQTNDPKIISALRECLSDRDQFVMYYAANALRQLNMIDEAVLNVYLKFARDSQRERFLHYNPLDREPVYHSELLDKEFVMDPECLNERSEERSSEPSESSDIEEHIQLEDYELPPDSESFLDRAFPQLKEANVEAIEAAMRVFGELLRRCNYFQQATQNAATSSTMDRHEERVGRRLT